MLTALTLARLGWKIVLVERNHASNVIGKRVAAKHCHLFSMDDLEYIATLAKPTRFQIPDFFTQRYCDQDAQRTSKKHSIPPRYWLDKQLLQSINHHSDIFIHWHCQVDKIISSGQNITCHLSNQQQLTASYVFDCSGRNRASYKATPNIHETVPILEADSYSEYRSWLIHRSELSRKVDSFSYKTTQDMTVHLLPYSHRQALLTLMAPFPLEESNCLETLHMTPLKHTTCLKHFVFEGSHRFVTHTSNCLVPTPDNSIAIPIGDSLLQTPPRYGGGLSQIIEQLKVVSLCLQQNTSTSTGDIQAALAKIAEKRWENIILNENLFG